jgi:hypothetical protein
VPRRNRPKPADPPRPLASAGLQRAEHATDGDWLVREITAAQATKPYRCPGCDHEIAPGIPHLVCWPAGDHGSVADRRHWHRGCWTARHRRGPTSRHW